MTKEEIQKHGEVIKWFIDNPDKEVWCKDNEGWFVTNNPTFYLNYAYVKNDEYAELRKAQADGKVIEFRQSEDDFWSETNNNNSFILPLSNYRIKCDTKNEFEIDYNNNTFIQSYYDPEFRELDIELGELRSDFKLVKRNKKEHKERNRLAELRDWLDPEWEADWNNDNQEKFFIGYSLYYEEFNISFTISHKAIGLVYMSRQTAEKIYKELNNPTCEQTRELAQILKGEK